MFAECSTWNIPSLGYLTLPYHLYGSARFSRLRITDVSFPVRYISDEFLGAEFFDFLTADYNRQFRA